MTLRDHGGGLTVRRRHPHAGRDDLEIEVHITDSRLDQLHVPLRLSGSAKRPVPSRASSGNPGSRGVVGLADLPDEAPAQHEQVTKQGVDRINRGAARPPGGCLVLCGVPVCPLHQGHTEHARAVSQARRGVAHDASRSERLGLSVSQRADTRERTRKEAGKGFGHGDTQVGGGFGPLPAVRWSTFGRWRGRRLWVWAAGEAARPQKVRQGGFHLAELDVLNAPREPSGREGIPLVPPKLETRHGLVREPH
jgi:hypothetical protein